MFFFTEFNWRLQLWQGCHIPKAERQGNCSIKMWPECCYREKDHPDT